MPWPPRARRFAGLAGHRDGRHIADQVGQHCRDDTEYWHLIIVAPQRTVQRQRAHRQAVSAPQALGDGMVHVRRRDVQFHGNRFRRTLELGEMVAAFVERMLTISSA